MFQRKKKMNDILTKENTLYTTIEEKVKPFKTSFLKINNKKYNLTPIIKNCSMTSQYNLEINQILIINTIYYMIDYIN